MQGRLPETTTFFMNPDISNFVTSIPGEPQENAGEGLNGKQNNKFHSYATRMWKENGTQLVL